MQLITSSRISRCFTDKKWFGPEKESLNLSNSFSSLPETLSRVIRTFCDFVPTISLSATDSYVSADGKSLVLAVEVYKQSSLTEEAKNKIFIGQFIHEMSHLRYTLPEESSIKRFGECKVKYELSNILEDKRIEQKASWEFPGFNKFLQITRSYYTALVFTNLIEGKRNIYSYNQAVITYIATRTLFPKILDLEDFRTSKANELINSFVSKETQEAINTIVDDCFLKSSLEDMDLKVEELYKFLNEKELDKDSAGSEGLSGSGSDTSSEKGSGISESIISSMALSESGLKEEDVKDEVRKLEKAVSRINEIISNEAETSSKSDSFEGGIPSSAKFAALSEFRDVPDVSEEKAKSKPLTSMSYKSLSAAFKVKIKTLGSFLDREKQYYEQSEGEIDEDEVSRVKVSRDLFTESDMNPELGLEIVTLLDLSGSMHGQNIENQKNLSVALADAFSKARGIKSKFYGHTTKNSYSTGFEKLKIVDFNTKNVLEALNSQEAESNNLDGFAIDFVATKFDKRSKSKILIVISDGAPSARSYGGSKAEAHVKSRVEQLARKGIQVLSVSLDSRYNESQKKMYTHIVPFSSFKQTMQDVAGWINSQFSRYSRTFNF